MEQKRYNGIDIIKLLAIIFVPFLHYFINYGYEQFEIYTPKFIYHFAVRNITFCCIGLFIMSTGYLQANKKPSLFYFKKVLRFVFTYLIVCAITVFCLENLTPVDLPFFDRLLFYFGQFPGYFWYMSFFLGVYFLIPYFNLISEKLNKKEFNLFIVIVLCVISVPEFFNSVAPVFHIKLFLPNFWREFFFLSYYFIGVYFRKFSPDISKKITAVIFVVLVSGISLFDYLMSRGAAALFFGGGYGNIVSVLITVCIFRLFYDMNIRSKMISVPIQFISCRTLEIYLMLFVSDKYTAAFVWNVTGASAPLPFRYIFLEAFTNFFIALAFAMIVRLICLICRSIFTKIKSVNGDGSH